MNGLRPQLAIRSHRIRISHSPRCFRGRTAWVRLRAAVAPLPELPSASLWLVNGQRGPTGRVVALGHPEGYGRFGGLACLWHARQFVRRWRDRHRGDFRRPRQNEFVLAISRAAVANVVGLHRASRRPSKKSPARVGADISPSQRTYHRQTVVARPRLGPTSPTIGFIGIVAATTAPEHSLPLATQPQTTATQHCR